MARQVIDTTTNNGSYIGDPAKTAFGKVNNMTDEIYTALSARVKQGGGINQSGNTIYIGWDGVDPRITVDTTDIGQIVVANRVGYFYANTGAAAVGSLAFCITGTTLSPGQTIGGGGIAWTNGSGENKGTISVGTWRCLGYPVTGGTALQVIGLFLRIA